MLIWGMPSIKLKNERGGIMLAKECIAMLLAGGQGSRLGYLTKRVAKPALPFGGKYRIIDFCLSNCNNSGIDTVGVLTQYKPFLLNSYIGVGSAWDLDHEEGGVHVLPPYTGEKGGEWFKGTADAIYQHMDFVKMYNPKYLLVISGDHIYKMDYSFMLEYHKDKKADATVAVQEVSWEEAGRFGITNTDEESRIVEFDEKPKKPRSNLASMGIYIFTWPVVQEYLEKDAKNPASEHDFGKNILPQILSEGRSIYAYRFNSYWKDVGTIESYYSANMDLLSARPELDIYDEYLKIYSKPPILPPHYISEKAKVQSSLIPDGCTILGEVEHSVLFPGVYVGEGSLVKECILLPNVKIGAGCIVKKAIIAENTTVGNYSRIGYDSSNIFNTTELTVIGDCINLPDRVEIKKGSKIGGWQNEESKIS